MAEQEQQAQQVQQRPVGQHQRQQQTQQQTEGREQELQQNLEQQHEPQVPHGLPAPRRARTHALSINFQVRQDDDQAAHALTPMDHGVGAGWEGPAMRPCYAGETPDR